MQAFQNEMKRFEELGAQVLGVSSDSVATHQEFSDKKGLTMPLVADDGGAIQKLYGSGRITFVIDKSGIIRFIQKGAPDTRVLLQELAKL